MLTNDLYKNVAQKLLRHTEDTYAPMWSRAAAATVLALWAGLLVLAIMLVIGVIGFMALAAFGVHWLVGTVAVVVAFYCAILFCFWLCE
jgi:hypothetical protein